MARTRKLPACPFCGSTNLVVRIDYTHAVYVTCAEEDCLASGPLRPDKKAAILAWKTRVREKTEEK